MASEYFLRIDGIPGESADAKHKGEIVVESFSWGESHSGPVAGGGAGAGRVNIQDLHVVAATSKASPQLMLACASGQHAASAVLTGRRAGERQEDFLRFSLSDVLVSSFQIAGSQADGTKDSVGLSFGQIVVEYRQRNPDGTLGATTKAGWDVKTNKKF